MTKKAAEIFALNGGNKLVGSNVLYCHPEPSRSKLLEMLAHRLKNSYTIEKIGTKKFIFQSPWYDNGKYSGFIELAEIPEVLPHFIRC